MPLDTTPEIHADGADVLPDTDDLSQVYGLPPLAAPAGPSVDVAAIERRVAALEEAARGVVDTIASDAQQRLSAVVTDAENRLVDALSLNEQQQRELARWREDAEERLRAAMRELGEWDETLTTMRQEAGGLREMAEAAIALASGDLDKRWDALRREIGDILTTAESDERARWEAFMASTADSLAVGSDGDPAAVEELRADIATIRDSVTKTVANFQQMQREQLAALHNEVHAMLETERGRVAHQMDQRLSEAQRAFQSHTTALQEWQQNVGHDVASLRESAGATEQRIRTATEGLQAEAQAAIRAVHTEIQNGIAQTRAAAQAEMGGVRTESTQALRRVQRQARTSQAMALAIAFFALAAGLGSLAVSFLHLH
jgi:hypothetical protein